MRNIENQELKDYYNFVQQYVRKVTRTSAKGIAENAELKLPDSIAEDLYAQRYGEEIYDFSIPAPSDRLFRLYQEENCWSNYTPTIKDFLSFLGSSKCNLFIARDKLLFMTSKRVVEHSYCYGEKTYEHLKTISKTNNVIDWSNANIYYKPISNLAYISDSWEPELASSKDREDEWFVLPYNDAICWCVLHQEALNKAADLVRNGITPTYLYSGITFYNQVKVGDEITDLPDPDVLYILTESGLLKLEDLGEKEIDGFWGPSKKRLFLVVEKNRREKKQRTNVRSVSTKYGSCITDLSIPDSFVGIDFETLYSQRVSACSVGMVKYKNGVIVDRYYSLIRPPFDYPTKSGCALTWIHGFTEDMLKDERTFDKILPEMEAFAEGLPLVAHNACVERSCILDSSNYYGISTSIDVYNIIDTYPLSKDIEKLTGLEIEGPGTHSLDVVCKRFEISCLAHHNALDDAEMCGNLLCRFREILNNSDFKLDISKVQKEVNVAAKKICEEDKIQVKDLDNIVDNPFKDKVVVLTGFCKATSQEYAHKLHELGAILKEGVTKKTQVLITGRNAGPAKIEKCKELGAEIISEEDFLEMIK